jgi:hypothetical protein
LQHFVPYRLPDDLYQTAKIAKVLLLMEKGDAAKYKNKSLDEIEINADEEVDFEEDENGDSGILLFSFNCSIKDTVLTSNQKDLLYVDLLVSCKYSANYYLREEDIHLNLSCIFKQ